MKTLKLMIVFLTLHTSVGWAVDQTTPYLYVLGVVQDAGYPQAGCYAVHCMPGWQDPSLRRGAASIGLIDPEANKKYLFEATPNLPEQLYQLELQAPAAQFSLAGIFLTHAHIGHYAGLMFLGHEAMGASNVNVYAMPRMAEYLGSNGPWSQLVDYKNIVLAPLQDGVAKKLGQQLTVEPFLVPHRDEFSETVGYRITGPNKSALFIPDINKWSEWKTDIAEVLKTVDFALLDATFYDDGELPGRDLSKVPHPFVVETMQRLQELPVSERNKVWFIHLNHSNPLLDSDSEQSQQVRANGFNIAVEGLKLDLLRERNMAWVILFVAGLFEVGWAIGLKYSDGFTKPVASTLTVIAMVVSVVLLGLAMKSLPVGTAYSVWVGIGAIGTVILGIFLFSEPAGFFRLASVGLIIAGVVGLKLATPS